MQLEKLQVNSPWRQGPLRADLYHDHDSGVGLAFCSGEDQPNAFQ
jgi:hypothetical protein